MQDKKLGRNPFEKKKMQAAAPLEPETVLFKDIVKPKGDMDKLKEMKIQVDWTELYQSLAKGISKYFLLLLFFLFTGCALSPKEAELKKQIVDLQKSHARQSNLIEELNSKIYLLSDRIDHYEKPATSPKASKLVNAPVEVSSSKPGDLKIYEMAMKDLKNQSMDGFTKKVDLLVKGYKNSPFTNNALYFLGERHFKMKNYLAASQVFEKLYSLSPDGNKAVSALFMLGQSYEKQKRDQEAREAFQTIINIYPGSKEAKESALKLNRVGKLNQGPR